MEEEKITQINAKLNPEYDSFIMEEIRKIPKRDRSRTYREALAFYFAHQRDQETQSIIREKLKNNPNWP